MIGTLGGAWQSRLGWYPGDWVWPSLIALIVAVLAGVGAWLFVRHDRAGTRAIENATSPYTTVATTSPKPPERTTSTAPTTSGRRATQPPATTPPQPPPPPPATAEIGWPAGRSGWTVVLNSIPTSSGRAFAQTQARAALRSGLRQVGILDSSVYSSLHPGYYVVFSGIYGSSADATTSGLSAARSHGYPRAYIRRITR
jgi:hypothetical protein